MTTKPQNFSDYPPDQTELAERVLLEVWTRLGDYHRHLVLIGGLAPRYLVPQERAANRAIPLHCGTMDVDLAVSLAVADRLTYASIRRTLIDSLGFRPGANPDGVEQRHSFVKEIGDATVVLDFLTTDYDGPDARIREVQKSLSAIKVEGLGLALENPLEILVEGDLLEDGRAETTLRVCRTVPFIVLKALALEKRAERKDAYDLVYVLRYASDGPAAIARTVTLEESDAPSFTHALDILRRKFQSPEHDGPTKYTRFVAESEPDAATQAFAAVQEFLRALEAPH